VRAVVARLTAALLTGALLTAALLAPAAHAHEVRPAILQATEIAPTLFQVVWKQPVLDDRRLPIEPVLPDDCERLGPPAGELADGALIERWQVRCSLRTGTLAVEGLSRTLTDAMVQIHYLQGDSRTELLRPANARMDLGDRAPAVAAYFGLGVEHLLLGIDHLLFLVGLVLFIHNPWSLVKTITAFTLAHSITLALSVLGHVALAPGPVEVVIALSILFLARELMLPEAQRSGLMRASPWLMALAFGLLHGFGFAGALTEFGLPREQIGLALLLFNLGIEAGQLVVVAGLLGTAWILRQLRVGLPAAFERGPAAAMGCVAGFWTVERIGALALF